MEMLLGGGLYMLIYEILHSFKRLFNRHLFAETWGLL